MDQSFPKGQALAAWLQNIGATPTLGDIDIHDAWHAVDAVNAPTTRWLYSQSPSVASVQAFSFNAPVGAKPEDQCGRAICTNFHIANQITPFGTLFPAECDDKPLTPQEKVLEFMLFDIASCVQADTDTPALPR